MILIDNYDSFTYNILQALRILGEKVEVVRNNSLSVRELLEKKPHRIVIGPGPGTPSKAGISKALIKHFCRPILGICLGHQAIGEVFGANLGYAKRVMHGKTSPIFHQGKGILRGLSNPFEAARYHSLILENLPDELEVTARSDIGEIMALQHVFCPIYGVQFHPESIATPQGIELLKNFCRG